MCAQNVEINVLFFILKGFGDFSHLVTFSYHKYSSRVILESVREGVVYAGSLPN